MHRTLRFIILFTFIIGIFFSFSSPASALTSTDVGIKLQKNNSYNKDGKFYMSFNITGSNTSPSLIKAEVVDASGKKVFGWKDYELDVMKTEKRSFGANYSNVATGTYTFVLTMYTTWDNQTFQWKYNINHNSNKAYGLNFSNCEKVMNNNGTESHKFTINCVNGKGRTPVLRIIDYNGSLVTLIEGPVLKSENTNVWFKWNGDSDIGSGYRCSSGNYTVQVYYQGEEKMVEKVYKLNIY